MNDHFHRLFYSWLVFNSFDTGEGVIFNLIVLLQLPLKVISLRWKRRANPHIARLFFYFMALTTPFTDEEYEEVIEICLLEYTDENYAMVKSRMDAFTDARAQSVRRDIAQWRAVKYGTTKTRGGIKGTDFDIERDRMRITNLVRPKIGLRRLPSQLGDNEIGFLRVRIGCW